MANTLLEDVPVLAPISTFQRTIHGSTGLIFLVSALDHTLSNNCPILLKFTDELFALYLTIEFHSKYKDIQVLVDRR